MRPGYFPDSGIDTDLFQSLKVSQTSVARTSGWGSWRFGVKAFELKVFEGRFGMKEEEVDESVGVGCGSPSPGNPPKALRVRESFQSCYSTQESCEKFVAKLALLENDFHDGETRVPEV